MAATVPYTRHNAYTDWSTNNPSDPHPGQDFDEDFDDLARFSAELLSQLGQIQREDGALADGVIDSADKFTPEYLAQLKAEIASAGITGIQGPIGPQGVVGPAGVQGPAGPPLPWIVGVAIPSNNIGVAYQLFLNTSNGDVYQKGASSWLLIGNLRGPGGTGGGGGISDHGLLSGLADPDHPISAVQGLPEALGDLQTAIVAMGAAQRNVYRQPAAPTANLNAGDLWFDSDNDDRLYRWDGTQWVDIADKRIATAMATAAEAITAAAGAQATADGRVTTFFGSTQPATARLGDLWIRTDQGNRLYRYSGTTWVNVADTSIADAILAAADAQSTADGKIETFYQPTAPAGASLGDLWYDTDDLNHPYRYNGAQWVSIRDASIAQAAAAAASAIATASQALSDVNVIADGVVEVFYSSTTPVSANVGDLWIKTNSGNQLHRYNGTQWVSVQDASIQSALTAAGLAQATADGKLRAFYQTTAPNAGSGRVTGDLWYDTDDNFRPYRFNGTAWQDISYILGVQGGLITGVSIQDGVITATKLAANSVTTAKLAADSVTADKINVASLSAITATIGLLRTATTGQRVEISSNLIQVFDSSNVLRVRMGIW